MQNNITPQQLRGAFKRQWKADNVWTKRVGRPGLSMRLVAKEAARLNRAHAIQTLDVWLELFDECVAWLVSLHYVLHPTKKNESALDGSQKALFCLVARIIVDLMAVRSLCLAGFDVSAKALLRSISEHLETAILICIEPDLANEFVETETREQSNHFWHKHLAKGKARQKIQSYWNEVLKDSDSAASISEFRNHHMDVTGMALHPSILAGYFSILPIGADDSPDAEWPLIFGRKARISERTLASAITMIFEFILLCDHIPFESRPRNNLHIPFDKENELHVHVKHGRLTLTSIILRAFGGGEDRFPRNILDPEWLAN